jgi:elongation of very long chain fatty acids protein 6
MYVHHRFELNADPVPVRDWMVDHAWLPFAACTIYAILIVWGQSFYFASRPAWDWRRLMAGWNLGLSVFSLCGLVRVLPQILHNLYHYNWVENMCLDPESHFGSGPTGVWVQAFVLSKFP